MNGKLVLENGMAFEGEIFGYSKGITGGEVVFNTGMTGYQEMITDPSYYGQVLVMTYPLIGNYGINTEDMESDGPKIKGLVVRELNDNPSNFRSEFDVDSYFKYHQIMGIQGIDTRALTRIIREEGVMKGLIVPDGEIYDTGVYAKVDEVIQNSVSAVSIKKINTLWGKGCHVGVLDFGMKYSILKEFQKRDCQLTLFPYDTDAETILKSGIDCLFLSNGPGNPEDLIEPIQTIKSLVGRLPIIGICLGHQLLALSLGGKTGKLKFGHRGGNHPVKNKKTGQIFVTSQNHGYHVVSMPKETDISYISLNDETVEGLISYKHQIYSVQFHPEAGPGPWESKIIFDDFLEFVSGFQPQKMCM